MAKAYTLWERVYGAPGIDKIADDFGRALDSLGEIRVVEFGRKIRVDPRHFSRAVTEAREQEDRD